MKPLIGVPSSPFQSKFAAMPIETVPEAELHYHWLLARLTYMICAAVRDAGGVPLELYATEDEKELETLVKRVDGFVFAGGEDVHPDFYNEAINGSIAPNLERDMFEFKLLEKVLDAGKPLLGICRGAQLINVGMGGTLIQHLPALKPEWTLHKRPDVMDGYVHDVEILKPELFPALRGQKMRVNSMHHQAVKDLAPELERAAETEDGLTEAFVAPKHTHLVGVQWHPECLSKSDSVQKEIFLRLIGASAAR